MSGKMARNKGQRGEREIIKLLTPVVDKVYAEFPELGEPPKLQRNTLQSDGGGFDIVGLDWLAIEVKFQENIQINPWWKQTISQAKPHQMPVLFYRKSHVKWRVMMKLYSPIGDKRFFCPADMSIENFMVYFEHRLRYELETVAKEVGNHFEVRDFR